MGFYNLISGIPTLLKSPSLNKFTEPTGNLSPKAPGEKYEGGKLITSALKKNVLIVCNVIGFPIPIYRYVIYLFIKDVYKTLESWNYWEQYTFSKKLQKSVCFNVFYIEMFVFGGVVPVLLCLFRI